mmetsp:Transcript_68752/g.129754  ORF Transcript_68752/g.129754 Transcript_68752/m.129754 type:complete len:279 (-) Transcript_68752:197-1033(-)
MVDMQGTRMYVKNTFLEFAPTEEPGEENIACERHGECGVPRASEEVESVKNIWASLKERHKTRAKSQPCRKLDDLMNSCFFRSPCTSSTSDQSERSSVSPTTRSQSPVSSGGVTPRLSVEVTEAQVAAQLTAEVPSQGIADAPPGLKKKVRSRPPKPKRMKGKDLARLLYSVQDATCEEKEEAECYFLRETQGDPVLYEYSMSVLQSMKQEGNGLEHGRDVQERPRATSQTSQASSVATSLATSQASTFATSLSSGACINLPRPSLTLPLMIGYVPAR